MVLYPNKLPESERVCSGICILQNIIKADCHASAKFHLLRGWYNVSLTDQKGKKVYLYTENAKRLIELLKEKNIEMSVL